MEIQNFHILMTLLLVAAVCQCGVIFPREEDEEAPMFKPFGKDKKLGGGSFGLDDEYDDTDNDIPSDYDNKKPEKGGEDKKRPEEMQPDIIFRRDEGRPVEGNDDKKDEDENPKEDGLNKKSGEDGYFEPFDESKDSEAPSDEDENEMDDNDMSVNKWEPEEDDEENPEGNDEDKKMQDEDEEDAKVPEEEEEEKKWPVDDEKDKYPFPGYDDEKYDENGHGGFFPWGSIFDTPIFNLEQVRKYFHQMEMALGQVFKQTMDEALLLNGTYANTTQEEVEINGKKYIVQKSIIKGSDNQSSIYVEALMASKPKTKSTKVA